MEIGATKSVQERLKTTKIDEIKGASLVFCWDTHLTKTFDENKRKKCPVYCKCQQSLHNSNDRYRTKKLEVLYIVYRLCDSWCDAADGIF